jgi:hypothetical protein
VNLWYNLWYSPLISSVSERIDQAVLVLMDVNLGSKLLAMDMVKVAGPLLYIGFHHKCEHLKSTFYTTLVFGDFCRSLIWM